MLWFIYVIAEKQATIQHRLFFFFLMRKTMNKKLQSDVLNLSFFSNFICFTYVPQNLCSAPISTCLELRRVSVITRLPRARSHAHNAQVLTRLLSEGRTRETAARGARLRRGSSAAAAAAGAGRGLPSARTESVLGWASAVLDAHFTSLAIGGAADTDLVGALKALKNAARVEAECCELLCEVRGRQEPCL